MKKKYFVNCPVCGAKNESEEPNMDMEWLDCKKCKLTVYVGFADKYVELPLYTLEQIAQLYKEGRMPGE